MSLKSNKEDQIFQDDSYQRRFTFRKDTLILNLGKYTFANHARILSA